jgi:hypothetical protein
VTSRSLASRHARSRAESRAGLTILVDNARSFADGRPCLVARTAEEGVALLHRHEFDAIDELWLESDLGWRHASPLTAAPVIDELVRAAAAHRPYNIGVVMVHTRNAVGAAGIKRALQDAGYPVRRHYDPRTLRRRF